MVSTTDSELDLRSETALCKSVTAASLRETISSVLSARSFSCFDAASAANSAIFACLLAALNSASRRSDSALKSAISRASCSYFALRFSRSCSNCAGVLCFALAV